MSYENKNWRRMLVMFAGHIIHSYREYKTNDILVFNGQHTTVSAIKVSLLPGLTCGTLYPKTFGKRISVTLISNDC